MAKYKDKHCVVCECVYSPSSPKQKSCTNDFCKAEVRRIAERKRYKKVRTVYTRRCVSCGIGFETTDSRRKYCGSDVCEKRRTYKKNKIADKKRRGKRKEEKRYYYIDNKEKIKEQKKIYYREVLHPERDVREGWPTEKLTYDFVKNFAKTKGYTIVSTEYVNTHSKIDLICTEGHFWSTSFHNFKDCGNECPRCVSKRIKSKPEEEIYDFVCSIVGENNVIDNSRNIIPPYELDIYIPEKNLAIEYCGLYWHGEISGGKDRRYHYNKMKLCNDNGIRLITIFADEYKERPIPIKSRIQNALGVGLERIFARKCKCVEITAKESNIFLDKYHLQGKSGARIRWGLFCNDLLVQVLTIGALSRPHAAVLKGHEGARLLELKRFASIPGVSVVGGAGKLFKRAVEYGKESEYTHIKSYCDMRYGNSFGPVYEKLGFDLMAYTKYTPHYVYGENRYRNQGLRKTPEERKTGLTEWELRQAQGYDRIWDCGHRTYIYTI